MPHPPVSVAVDAHLHLYPAYDLSAALAHLSRNLAAAAPGAIGVGILAERTDCRMHARMRQSGWVGRKRKGGVCCQPSATAGDPALRLRFAGLPDVILLPGRQIVTSERIEILALLADLEVPDGLPAETVVRRVLAAGALPVLPWSPGKWFFGRRQTIEQLLATFGPPQLLVGDTPLRPLGYPEPILMKRARLRGYRVVAGSDPLPFAGEERQLGRYATVGSSSAFDLHYPTESVRKLLTAAIGGVPVGRRCTPLELARRLGRNALVRRRERQVRL